MHIITGDYSACDININIYYKQVAINGKEMLMTKYKKNISTYHPHQRNIVYIPFEEVISKPVHWLRIIINDNANIYVIIPGYKKNTTVVNWLYI